MLLDKGYHEGRLSLRRVAELLTSAPAALFGLNDKGRLAIGGDGDLTLVDLDRVRAVKPEELGSYSDYSLYEGWTFKGWPVRTILRGQTIMADGAITGAGGYGRYLARGDTPPTAPVLAR